MQEVERLCEVLSIERLEHSHVTWIISFTYSSLQGLNQELVSASLEEGGIVIDREITIIIKKDEEEEKKMQQARSKGMHVTVYVCKCVYTCLYICM